MIKSTNDYVNSINAAFDLTWDGPITKSSQLSGKPPACGYVYGIFHGKDTCIHIGKSKIQNWSRAKDCFRLTFGAHNKSLFISNFKKAHTDTYLVIFKDLQGRSAGNLEKLISEHVCKRKSWLPVYEGSAQIPTTVMFICSAKNDNPRLVGEFCRDFATNSDAVTFLVKWKKYLNKGFYEEFKQALGTYYNL